MVGTFFRKESATKKLFPKSNARSCGYPQAEISSRKVISISNGLSIWAEI
jgi:hypothetical protein